ncbi:hypothetical protein HN014_10700 [Aquimarina sp. TRL1]|uniref:hypothetical protein n=1 Tax=Aquimarina sp. (strain TRL1) TaxID=2736252 RepID=UPI001588AD80|nr:hypothetical protein [Aquimarina sp. TRL1]QKX05363.1 hypothetical protein HN014_10700 [Aquimarina sp. TRL1]
MTHRQQTYNQTINLISHLILTEPHAVVSLLESYGAYFNTPPNRKELIDLVLEQIKEGSQDFEEALGDLITLHIQKNGKAMLALDQKEYASYYDATQEDEDAFWGTLAKVGIGLVGKLIGKKKGNKRSQRSHSRGGGRSHAAVLAASRAQAQRAARQVEQMRRDMQRQMQQMIKRQEQELRKQREKQKQREKELEEKAKKSRNMILMVAGGITGLTLLGFIVLSKNKATPATAMQMPYTPAISLTPGVPR